jgi:hypothetical protein
MVLALAAEDWHSRPWAAYVLGHEAVALELWWAVFIQVPGEEYEAQDGVPFCLDVMRQAVSELAGEIDVGMSTEISKVLAQLSRGFSRWAKSDLPLSHSRRSWYPPVPFDQKRQLLLRLANRALPPSTNLRGWFDLGHAVGRARLHLYRGTDYERRNDDRETRQSRDSRGLINDVIHAALTLSKLDRGSIPIAKTLASFKKVASVESACRSLKRLVGYHDKPSIPGWPLLDSLLATLDSRLREQLRVWNVLDIQRQTSRKRQAKQEPPRTGWAKDVQARNKWIYDQVMRGTGYKNIIAELRRRSATKGGWQAISSIAGVKKAAVAYAERMKLDVPPKRRAGRPTTIETELR